MTIESVRVTGMGRAAGTGIARTEILRIASGSAAQTAAHTDGVLLNQVIFRIHNWGAVSNRIMVVCVGRQAPRPIDGKRNTPVDVVGNRVAVDGRRAAAGDADAPIVVGEQVMEDMRLGAAGDGYAVARIVLYGVARRRPRRGMFPPPGANQGKGILVHADAVAGVISHRGASDSSPSAVANGNAITGAVLDGDVSKRDPAALNGDQRLIAAEVERCRR